MKFDNLLYYSTNTQLAYWLNENFYNGQHFVWCAPVWDPTALDAFDIRRNIPSSSSPVKIYNTFKEDCLQEDDHSAKILSARTNLKVGANIQHSNGTINDEELASVLNIIDTAGYSKFHPLVYLIPKHLVETKIIKVSVEKAANPLSIEYQIIDLRKNEFELIKF